MDNIQKSLLKNKNWHEIVINKNFSSQSKKMDINRLLNNLHSKKIEKKLFRKKLFITITGLIFCLLYTSPSPRDLSTSRMPSSA